MGRLSVELRETIIELHKSGQKPGAILKCLPQRVDLSSIYKLVKKYKIIGSVKDKSKKRVSKFTPEMANIVSEVYENDR